MKINLDIDTDKNRLDVGFIYRFISNSYWAQGRSVEIIKNCISHSLNFGVYLSDKQIGYGRVVTDYEILAYLMDVFIDEDYRGNGYSKQLINVILNFPALSNVKTWRLATRDAHGLYKQFGFRKSEDTDKFMELIRS